MGIFPYLPDPPPSRWGMHCYQYVFVLHCKWRTAWDWTKFLSILISMCILWLWVMKVQVLSCALLFSKSLPNTCSSIFKILNANTYPCVYLCVVTRGCGAGQASSLHSTDSKAAVWLLHNKTGPIKTIQKDPFHIVFLPGSVQGFLFRSVSYLSVWMCW